jgi:hypothetical protein
VSSWHHAVGVVVVGGIIVVAAAKVVVVVVVVVAVVVVVVILWLSLSPYCPFVRLRCQRAETVENQHTRVVRVNNSSKLQGETKKLQSRAHTLVVVDAVVVCTVVAVVVIVVVELLEGPGRCKEVIFRGSGGDSVPCSELDKCSANRDVVDDLLPQILNERAVTFGALRAQHNISQPHQQQISTTQTTKQSNLITLTASKQQPRGR